MPAGQDLLGDAPPPGVGGPPQPPPPAGPAGGRALRDLGPAARADAAGLPGQQDIETAAAVMEKALEIVVSDEAPTKRSRARCGTCCCRAVASAACAGNPSSSRSRSRTP